MKISTDNYKNRPLRYPRDRFYIENLFDFLKKSDKISEIAYGCLVNSRNQAVCNSADSESEEFLVEPLLSEDRRNDRIVA
jgi:hypothetical protein